MDNNRICKDRLNALSTILNPTALHRAADLLQVSCLPASATAALLMHHLTARAAMTIFPTARQRHAAVQVWRLMKIFLQLRWCKYVSGCKHINRYRWLLGRRCRQDGWTR